MTSSRLRVLAASVSALVPLAGCTFLVSFDDADGGKGSIATSDATVPALDSATAVDAPSPPAVDADTQDASSESDAADDSSEVPNDPPATVITTNGDAGVKPPGKPPPGSSDPLFHELPAACQSGIVNPCGVAPGGVSTWYCLSDLNVAGAGCDSDSQTVVFCRSDGGFGGASYICPSGVQCVQPGGLTSFFSAICNPCPPGSNGTVCDIYDDSSHDAYKLQCNDGLPVTAGSETCGTTGDIPSDYNCANCQ